MVYSIDDLRNRIDSYFSGTLSKNELGEWAQKAYYDLLTGGYIETDKIVQYPFIKTLSCIHVISNDIEDTYPCSENDVKEIQSIVCGDKAFDFQIGLSIPLKVYNMFAERPHFNTEKREKFCKLKDIVLDYRQHNFVDSNALSQILHLCSIANLEPTTILDILEEHIVKLCTSTFDINSSELKQKTISKIYPQKAERDNSVEKLIDYLDCYIGNREFSVLVSYRKGIPDILLLI